MPVKKVQNNILLFAVSICIFAMVSCVRTETAITTEEQLGEKLFFDPILSRDSTISCGSCHKPDLAFADNVPFSEGVFHRKGNRNTPSAMNQSDRNFYFWDGRAESLEEQALGPMENHVEMDFPLTRSIRRLIANPQYNKAFRRIYGETPSKILLARAISSFERSLETSASPFDRYVSGDDTLDYPDSAKRGLSIFNGKGKCFDCHFGVDFTGGDQFRNIGLYNGKQFNDRGRMEVTGKSSDLGRFKVPGLRNVAVTAPYMHNGMFRSLKEVIEFYNEPDKFVSDAINRDTLLRKPLGLTKEEMEDLEHFLVTLTDDRFRKNNR
jgi:cytochrome c peroxidase